MAIHNVTDSALLVKKSRKTIQRYIANGKLTVTRDQLGNPQIDTAELIRVFGKLSQVSQNKISKKSHNVAPELSHQNDDRISKLMLAVETLQKTVTEQSEQIASLTNLLEYKPVTMPSKGKTSARISWRTPLGVFDSCKSAAEEHGINARTMNDWFNKTGDRYKDFYKF
jgi:hypothetical protein